MPNSPSRIDGNYDITEKEEVKYADPGDFGALRPKNHISLRIYVGMLIVLAMAVILAIAYWVGA